MSKVKEIFLLVVILVSAGLSGCGPATVVSPADIGIVLAGMQPCELTTGSTLPISLKGSIPSNAEIEWSATGGSFNPSQGFPTVYTAPTQPGDVVITVKVTISGIKQLVNVNCSIKAGTPTTPPDPTATFTPTPTATILTPTATPTLMPTDTPTATPTPDWLLLASTENTDGWTAEFRKSNGLQLQNNVTVDNGEPGNALRLSFDVQNSGYVTMTHNLSAQDVLRTRGLRFNYLGKSADPNGIKVNNTIEFKLIFRWPGDNDDTTFGFTMNHATNTDGKWVKVERTYAEITCWWPANLCRRHNNTMDFNYISRMDYVVSNKVDKGDVAGTGYVIFEDLQGILR